MSSSLLTLIGLIVAAVLVLLGVFVLVFKLCFKVPAANKVLVITGRKEAPAEGVAETMTFRVSTTGTLVLPLLEKSDELDLSNTTVEMIVKCPTHQGVQLDVKGVVTYKVGDDEASMRNAARRFLGKTEGQISDQVKRVFSGHLRSIVGSMTVEDIIRDREKLTSETRKACAEEVQSLGLVIDSLQIEEVDDPTNYISKLAQPELARVASDSRVATALQEQRANEAEQQSRIKVAQSKRDTDIAVAAINAEVQAREAEAAQQGPLAQAKAKQAVLEEQAKAAIKQAEVKDAELKATVYKEADAQRYQTEQMAEAEANSKIAKANAEATAKERTAEADKTAGLALAEVKRADGQAEADNIKARAEAMKEGQDGVIAQMQQEQMPQIAAALANSMSKVGNITILDGAAGFEKMLMGLASMAPQLAAAVRQATTATTNGGGADQ